LNSKMLLAPVLAVFSALLIAVAVTMFLPLNQPEVTAPMQANTLGGAAPMPTAAASAADVSFLPLTIMLIVAAVVVCLAVVIVFFRREPQ
jgi:hypothetical protein